MRILHIGPAALRACLEPFASAPQGDGTEVVYPDHVFKPDQVAATPERIAALKAPPGFRVSSRGVQYADGVSMPLQWSAVPGGRSDLVVMEDPDARPVTPFVQWLAWSIPGGVITLPEGLQEQPRLTDPAGVLQGRTSRDSVGCYGPRPPVGDPPHHDHLQVGALDTMLNVPPFADRDRDRVLAAARGHVIAKGRLVGTHQQTVQPPK